MCRSFVEEHRCLHVDHGAMRERTIGCERELLQRCHSLKSGGAAKMSLLSMETSLVPCAWCRRRLLFFHGDLVVMDGSAQDELLHHTDPVESQRITLAVR